MYSWQISVDTFVKGKISPQKYQTLDTGFQILGMANLKPVFAGAGRWPARGNQNQEANENLVNQYHCESSVDKYPTMLKPK